MAIIERKQLTGSTAKINQYAGHEGQLVFDKQTKHLHVLSGTAGTSTKLANVSDIPAPQDISGKADKTYVDQQLATKEAKGTAYSKSESDGKYATKTELSGKANTSHTHTKAQITDFPSIPDVSTLIPKTGDRGSLAGWETLVESIETTSVTAETPDCFGFELGGTTNVPNSGDRQTWTKVGLLGLGSISKVTFGDKWKWSGGKAPEFKLTGYIVLLWTGGGGVATYITTE